MEVVHNQETVSEEKKEITREEVAVSDPEAIDKGKLNNKPVPIKSQPIIICEPAFAGYRIHRTFGKVHVDFPGKPKSMTEMSGGFQEALAYITEMRVMSELSGEMSLEAYNAGVEKIQAEINAVPGIRQGKTK